MTEPTTPAGAFDDAPEPRTFTPAWLSPGDVKDWLRLNGQDTSDDALILRCSAAAEPYVQERRPEWWKVNDDQVRVYDPDGETYQGAVMVAARDYRRRNSPAGIESFDGVTSFVSRFDPDIDRALRIGDFARPVLG